MNLTLELQSAMLMKRIHVEKYEWRGPTGMDLGRIVRARSSDLAVICVERVLRVHAFSRWCRGRRAWKLRHACLPASGGKKSQRSSLQNKEKALLGFVQSGGYIF